MRKDTNNGMLSPVDVETRQQKLNEAGVWLAAPHFDLIWSWA